MTNFDVVIAGGGVTGCSTAFWLASHPNFNGTIAVVERDPTYANAPSAKASGGIRQQFSTPENVQIGLFGAQFVKSIEERLAVDGESTGVFFREQGYLLLATPEALPIMRNAHEVQLANGADIVFKDCADLEREFPWINVSQLAGAFFGQSNEGWVDPYSLLQAYRRKARSLGVTFIKDDVASIDHTGHKANGVHLREGGLVSTGTVVNAAGARGALALARGVGMELPLSSRLRSTFVFECKENIAHGQLTVLPNGCAWRPEGSRFITNMAPPPEEDLETFEHEINYTQFDEVIWPSLAEWVPAFEAIKFSHAYSCHYDFNTLDENLIIDRCGELDNCFVAAGFSGHGMQQSPAVGRALSELICDGRFTTLDLSRFDFGRVQRGEGIHEFNCW